MPLSAFDIVPFSVKLDWSARITDPEVLRALHQPAGGMSLRRLWQQFIPESRERQAGQVRRILSGSNRFAALVCLNTEGAGLREVLIRAKAKRDGQTVLLEGVLCDLTEELKTRNESLSAVQGRADMAVRELNHRVRNIMSVVTALITLSARFAEDVDTFSAATLGRIHALNIAYSNTGIDPANPKNLRSVVDFHGLAEGVLAPFRSDGREFAFEGAGFVLTPGQASAIGLILHELASNAIKHGDPNASSEPIHLSWKRNGSLFEVRWSEPAARDNPDFDDGFGNTIIKLFARNYLNGEAKWTVENRRLVATIVGVEN
ncbi:MAG: HWE histidine kinase domain-containing protein [Parvularcula sp.]|jgi:two-component sensor histidine kinase|nr:HWE histidine kinase domain-containing protein [Parvularcula sp.]